MSDKKSVKAGRPAFFSNPEIDRLLAINVRLMTEHSVLSERVKTLESLLIESGAITREALEAFEPSEAQDAEWGQDRFQLIKDVLESGQTLQNNKKRTDHGCFLAVSAYLAAGFLGRHRHRRVHRRQVV